MTDKKISQLDAASALDGTELVEVVQVGANKRTTAQAIADLFVEGSVLVHQTTEPADGDLAPGDCILWYDAINGAPGSSRLRAKAKTLDGTVVSAVVAVLA